MSTAHLIADLLLWACILFLVIRALRRWWAGPPERTDYQELIDQVAQYDQRMMYMHQNLNEAERRVESMIKYRTEEGMNELSMKAALDIEDTFIRSNFNGREGRLKDAQKVVKKALSEVLTGTNYYKGGGHSCQYSAE